MAPAAAEPAKVVAPAVVRRRERGHPEGGARVQDGEAMEDSVECAARHRSRCSHCLGRSWRTRPRAHRRRTRCRRRRRTSPSRAHAATAEAEDRVAAALMAAGRVAEMETERSVEHRG